MVLLVLWRLVGCGDGAGKSLRLSGVLSASGDGGLKVGESG